MSRIDKIKEMLAQSGRDSFLEHALALEYLKIDKKQEALDVFTTLLERDSVYLGSYYHLGKLYETMGQTQTAMDTYEKGMKLAKSVKDMHSFNELRSAYDDLMG
jgi:Tfp pilus assembly protein PilF